MTENRSGNIWTEDELVHLLKQIKESELSWVEIANNHGRSVNSVQMKVINYYLKDSDLKTSESVFIDLSKKLNVSIDLVKKVFNYIHQLKTTKTTKTRKSKKYNLDDFKILHEFKTFLLSKYELDNDFHTIFDEFLNQKINS